MTINHPDYQQEVQRLNYTKDYIVKILEASEHMQESYKDNIKDAFVNLDYLDSSLSYINILVNAKFFEMTSSELDHLKRVASKPYFGRIDFQNDETDHPSSYYIGKVSLFKKDTQESIIVDWRSPVASLYYDGRLGEVEYETEDQVHSGNLSLKRQYVIEDGELEEIRDIDITTRDELLQSSLTGSSNNRLTEIVSTIQAEQNEVIRSDLSKPVIVQGVAGSGKTTIALHRLSMFIYSYADRVSPSEMMILAPNRLFINYISEALPELGVEQIRQTTFIDYVEKSIKKKLKLIHPDEKLLQLLEPGHHDLSKWSSEFKGSMEFKNLIDQFILDIEKSFTINEHFKVEGFTLYKANKINQLFFEEYRYLPIDKRIKKIKGVLQATFKKKKKEMIKLIENKFDDQFDRLYYSPNYTEERRKKVIKLNEEKDKRIARIKKTSIKVVSDFLKQYELKKPWDYYHKLMSNSDQMKVFTNDSLTDEQQKYLVESFNQHIKKKKYELEDLAPLLYLQYRLYGIKKENKAKNVVIDEAQDYSIFQMYALRMSTETDLFTVLGDLSQGIHSYRGLTSWEQLIEQVFPRALYRTLKKSYRTTIEIMNLANSLLENTQPHLDTAEPVVRHGPLPSFIQIKNEEEAKEKLINVLAQVKSDEMETISIISKTKKEAKNILKLMENSSDYSFQLLEENNAIEDDKIAIVPSHLAKGLEFDAVILMNLSESYFHKELDAKLLYVAMTRPLHQLYLVGTSREGFLLEETNSPFFNETLNKKGG
ncbi:RNA polymerase recycling motor HelD [Halobacillus campisalis]|uniref:RNA polymerase recycling motor HelD n=1 Tax=Halobacillus campisalis TaxID=435909 RepID=A0ABW2K5Z7_9BACI|nr:RNA polymerase recycling motor HelD [Halobacillus campisalis]